MSTTDPRVTPTPSDPSPAGTDATSRSGAPAGTTVAVATGVEVALAAVQQQLLRQAETVRLETVQVIPAPVLAPAPVMRPAPPPEVIAAAPVRVREVKPAVVADDDTDAEFWGESRRRGSERRIDPEDLTRDERKALGKLKARKVRRIVRSVSPWSVFKFSIFFYLCLWLILMVAGVILWKLAVTSGVVTNIEKFYAKAAGEKSFELDGRSLFKAGASAGAILVLAATAFTVLMSVLFNLITDLTGGVKMTVLELESARRDLRRRRPSAASVKAKAAIDGTTEDESDDASETPDEVVAATKKPAPKVPSLTPSPAAAKSTDKAPRHETAGLDWSKASTSASGTNKT